MPVCRILEYIHRFLYYDFLRPRLSHTAVVYTLALYLAIKVFYTCPEGMSQICSRDRTDRTSIYFCKRVLLTKKKAWRFLTFCVRVRLCTTIRLANIKFRLYNTFESTINQQILRWCPQHACMHISHTSRTTGLRLVLTSETGFVIPRPISNWSIYYSCSSNTIRCIRIFKL